MLISRPVLSMAGTGFAAGIHMTSLRFKPRDIGFARRVEAGLWNRGSLQPPGCGIRFYFAITEASTGRARRPPPSRSPSVAT